MIRLELYIEKRGRYFSISLFRIVYLFIDQTTIVRLELRNLIIITTNSNIQKNCENLIEI